MSPKEVIALAKARDAQIIDLKFCDLLGSWQHFSIPVSELTEALFEDGIGFDGSSVRGWKGIEVSDMLLLPDSATAWLDPFIEATTLSLICDVEDPVTREPYERSPRGVARKAEAYLRSTGIADEALFGPEAEFFIFDDVRYQTQAHTASYAVDSEEGVWNSGRDDIPNLGHKIRHKEGYCPVPPADRTKDLRNEMVLVMQELGLRVEAQHHEVASGGQGEINLRFDTLLRMADMLMTYKYVVKNVAERYGKTATFMPKPLYGDNGSGMHTHQSLRLGPRPLFAGESYGNLSDLGLYYIGGLLKHAPALCALCNPTNNSYKRLVPGYEAPVTFA